MADESIINKIKALRAKASNHASTEAEVRAAAAAITKLMMKHDVEESQLIDRPNVRAVHATTQPNKNDVGVVISNCWRGIQALTEARLYAEGLVTNYVGAPADVEMALYLHEMLTIHARRAWHRYRAELSETGQKKTPTARFDFYTAFGRRMEERVQELAAMRRANVERGTALVVHKSALAKEKLKEMGIVLRAGISNRGTTDGRAAGAGANAANNVNLNRPFAGHGNHERIAR